MAIFETRYNEIRKIDETVQYNAHILTTINKGGYTEYVIKIHRTYYPNTSWKIYKRYNDFVKLHKSLCASPICPNLPGKKLIGNMHPDFIVQRSSQLQEYINKILMNPILASSLNTKRFVDPELYAIPFHDLALQYASLCLRSEGLWVVGQSLGPIGWRVRKHYFKVAQRPNTTKHSPGTQKHHLSKSASQSHGKNYAISSPSSSFEKDLKETTKDEYWLNWTEFGPDRFIDEKELNNVCKILTFIEHPYIWPIEYIGSGENGGLVIRKFNKAGTLKDQICGCGPISPFLTKYGKPRGRSPIPLKEVALYGCQIIEALKFLHSKGISHGHLHTGNVIVIDGCAKLLEIENFIFGVPSFYRPFFIQHCKINTLEAIDVYAFGNFMYELAMGYPLQDSYVRQIVDCPDTLKNLLESILLKESLKAGLPTLEQLVNHPFFTEYIPGFDEINKKILNQNTVQFKLTQTSKETLSMQYQKCEKRLRDEQRSVKNQKRLVRVQELMTSEEKEKKQKQKKTEHRQAKLRAQNSLQLPNGPPTVTPAIVKSDSVSSISSSQTKQQPTTVLTPPPIPTSSRHEFMTLSTDHRHVQQPSTSSNSSSLCNQMTKTEISNQRSELARNELLESICNFKRGELRKVNSN